MHNLRAKKSGHVQIHSRTNTWMRCTISLIESNKNSYMKVTLECTKRLILFGVIIICWQFLSAPYTANKIISTRSGLLVSSRCWKYIDWPEQYKVVMLFHFYKNDRKCLVFETVSFQLWICMTTYDLWLVKEAKFSFLNHKHYQNAS